MVTQTKLKEKQQRNFREIHKSFLKTKISDCFLTRREEFYRNINHLDKMVDYLDRVENEFNREIIFLILTFQVGHDWTWNPKCAVSVEKYLQAHKFLKFSFSWTGYLTIIIIYIFHTRFIKSSSLSCGDTV